MKTAGPSLSVSYRHGRVFAAYYHLPRESADASAYSRPMDPGLVVDFDSEERPIGIEILDPENLTVEAFNGVLDELGIPRVREADLAPLHAA
jgi:hypothetical protein